MAEVQKKIKRVNQQKQQFWDMICRKRVTLSLHEHCVKANKREKNILNVAASSPSHDHSM